jgi:hypothetical protein
MARAVGARLARYRRLPLDPEAAAMTGGASGFAGGNKTTGGNHCRAFAAVPDEPAETICHGFPRISGSRH